jgi:predicted nucleic acid-binding protein
MIVVDASVAALWWLPQPRAEAAAAVLAAPNMLVAPSLIRLEVGSALLRAARRRELAWGTAIKIVSTLLPSSVIFDDAAADADAAFMIAQRHGGSIYDAIYIALAQRLDAVLVTDDARMRSVALAAGVEVRLLEEQPS